MCFSATASFVAGGVLSATGFLTISKVKTKKEFPLATIPLLFGIQQLIDGVVWVSFGAPLVHFYAVYAYSFFSLVLWPVFIPLAVLVVERNRTRREILEALSVIGLCVGLFFTYYIFSGTTTAQIINHCVAYDTTHPYRFSVLAFYFLATSGAFFASSNKILNILGAVLSVSFFIAGWFYIQAFSSTWCFFSAILSAILLWYFLSRR